MAIAQLKPDVLTVVSDFDLSSISGTDVFEESKKIGLEEKLQALYKTAESSNEVKNFLSEREIPAKAARIIFSVAAGVASYFLFGHDNLAAMLGAYFVQSTFMQSFKMELQNVKAKWLRENLPDDVIQFRNRVMESLTPQALKRFKLGQKPQKPFSAIPVNSILSGPRSLIPASEDQNV